MTVISYLLAKHRGSTNLGRRSFRLAADPPLRGWASKTDALAYLTPVATENRIRAGADAAMGYPRFGMFDLLKLLGGVLVGVFRSHAAREAETAFLRQQLVVLQRSAPARLRLRTADRLIFVWLYRLFPSVLEAAVVFKPETLVRWHRSGFRLYWRWKSRRRVGRRKVGQISPCGNI